MSHEAETILRYRLALAKIACGYRAPVTIAVEAMYPEFTEHASRRKPKVRASRRD